MKKLVLAALLIAASLTFADAALAQAPPLDSAEQGWVDWIVGIARENKPLALAIIFGLAFGESIAFVSLILPFWGILVALGAILTALGFNFWEIMFASAAGAALGDWLSYWLGYHYSEKLFNMWPLSKKPKLKAMGHALFERWGDPAIWIARFSGPLRASVPIVAGAVLMPSWRFQLSNWGSALLWAYVLLQSGDIMGKVYLYFTG